MNALHITLFISIYLILSTDNCTEYIPVRCTFDISGIIQRYKDFSALHPYLFTLYCFTDNCTVLYCTERSRSRSLSEVEAGC